MANMIGLLAYAVQQADTARGALLRSTVATALAYHEALVTQGDKAADEVKAAVKKAFRDRGEDRKTADRVVNNACKMAAPLIEKIAPRVSNWDNSVTGLMDEVLALLALDDVRNVAALAVYLGTAKPEKAKVEKGADLAATLGAMADAGDVGQQPAGKPSEAKPEPAAMSQNEAFSPASLDLSTLDNEQLAMLAEMIAAEMSARAQRVAIAA